MKKSSSKPTRNRPVPENCDGSPPYPTTPPAPLEIPGEELLDCVFYGATDTAKAFNDGQLVQHTMHMAGGEQAYVFSLRGGPHKRRTLSKLNLKALLGPCTIVVQNGSSTTLQTNDTMDVPAGSTFSFATPDKAVIQGRSLAGPGLGKPRGSGGGDQP